MKIDRLPTMGKANNLANLNHLIKIVVQKSKLFNLKIMLRNLQRGGVYSAINVGGLVGGISLGISLLTVGFQAVKAAIENPVKSIKSE